MSCRKHKIKGYCARCGDVSRKAAQRRDALRWRWLQLHPTLAALFCMEATNRDTYGGSDPTQDRITNYLNYRVDEERN